MEPDRSFGRPEGLFMGRMDRFIYGNDPLGEPIDPPDDKMDPFRHANDPLNGKKDLFRKQTILFEKKGSIMKEKNH